MIGTARLKGDVQFAKFTGANHKEIYEFLGKEWNGDATPVSKEIMVDNINHPIGTYWVKKDPLQMRVLTEKAFQEFYSLDGLNFDVPEGMPVKDLIEGLKKFPSSAQLSCRVNPLNTDKLFFMYREENNVIEYGIV